MNKELNRPLFRAQVLKQVESSTSPVPTSPISWTVLSCSIGLAAGLFIAFLCTAEYARKQTVSGSLVSSSAIMRVAAGRTGILTDLKVSEGASVEAGAPLFTVSSQQNLERGSTLGTALLASLNAQIQLLKEQIAAEPERLANEDQRLETSLTSTAAQLAALAEQKRFQEERIVAATERRQSLLQLFERGSATKVALQDQEDILLSTRQALAELGRQQASLEREFKQTRLQREQLPGESRERVAQLRLTVADRERDLAEIEARDAQVLRAPLAGQVTALQAYPGQTVDASRPILTLVPDGAELKAELFVPSRAIGFVEPGQDVRLMIDAFPYQRFGTLQGQVETVSRAAISPGQAFGTVNLQEPAYRITVRLPRQTISAFGREFPLQPDMTVRADIILEHRSLIEWLFEPLLSLRGRM